MINSDKGKYLVGGKEVNSKGVLPYNNLICDFLSEFSTNSKFADFAGFIIYDKDGEESFSFGKHKGQKVKTVMEKEPGYFGWIMNADFPIYTKKVLTAIRLKNSNT